MTGLLIEVMGWVGSVLILASYSLLTLRKISGSSATYQWMNLAGALCIIANSFSHRAYPSVGLNVVWLLIAVYGLIRAREGVARNGLG